MDSETRAYLEQTLGAFRAEFRRDIGTLSEGIGSLRGEVGELRGRVDELRGEVSELQGQVGELRGQVGELRAEVIGLNGRVDGLHEELTELRDEFYAFRQEARSTADETRRHFHVLTEDLRHDLRGMAEGVIGLSERVDRMHAGLRTEMSERFTASHAVVRVAFSQVRRDIYDLRSRL